MFTTLPPPLLSINGAHACVHRNGPVRLVASTRVQSSTVVSRIGLNTAMPALFTSASRRPKRRSTCAMAASTSAGWDTSHTMDRTSVGAARLAVVVASVVASMSRRATASPEARNFRAIASPSRARRR